MEQKCSGSATLMILMCMVGITFIAITALKSTITFYELVLERLAYIKQEKAAEALVLYGVAMACAASSQNSYTVTHWPPPEGMYQGRVKIIPQEHDSYVIAHLLQEENILVSRACRVILEDDGWRIVEEKVPAITF